VGDGLFPGSVAKAVVFQDVLAEAFGIDKLVRGMIMSMMMMIMIMMRMRMIMLIVVVVVMLT
jgi:hypothetical protein